jgi:zinc and cadmium transporter
VCTSPWQAGARSASPATCWPTRSAASRRFLAFAAGNFVSIASSDLIPEIEHEEDSRQASLYFVVFPLGIGLSNAVCLVRA